MRDIKCCDKEDPKESIRIHHDSDEEFSDGDEVEEWMGYYECRKICNRFAIPATTVKWKLLTILDISHVVFTGVAKSVILKTQRLEYVLQIPRSLHIVLVVKRLSPSSCPSRGRTARLPFHLARKFATRFFRVDTIAPRLATTANAACA